MAADGHNFIAYYAVLMTGILFLPIPWPIKLFAWVCGLSCIQMQWMAANLSAWFVKLYASANCDFQFILIFIVFLSLIILLKPSMNSWLNLLVVIALIEIMRISAQRLGWDPVFVPMGTCKTITVAAGSHGNIGWTGMALAMCGPAFFRKRLWIGLIPLAGALYILKSSTPVVALAAAGMLFALYRFSCRGRIWAISGILMAVLAYVIYDPVMIGGGLNTRLMNWNRAWALCLGQSHSLIGYGLGSWIVLFPGGGFNFHRAHCEPIQVYFELGMLGVLVLLLYGRYLIKRFLDGGRGRASLLASCGMVTVIMCSLGNFPFHLAGTAIIAVGWMGIFEVATRND